MLTAHLRLAALVAAALVACRAAGGRLDGILVVDDSGDTVGLAAPARRVVSLNPTVTELVFALGAGDRLVGRTDQCDYPARAARVPSVGGWLPPNVEAVAARSPDLVVLYQGPTTAPAAARLRALGFAVLALRTDHLADLSRLARLLGPALGAVRAADSLASSYDKALDTLRRASASGPAPAVAILAWDQPLIVLGAGSFVSELVERAGARNAFGDFPSSSAPVSLESLVARAPRAVITLGGVTVGFAARPEWQAVRAVREHRLLNLTESALTRPSPRAPAAIAALRHRLEAVLHANPHQEISP